MLCDLMVGSVAVCTLCVLLLTTSEEGFALQASLHLWLVVVEAQPSYISVLIWRDTKRYRATKLHQVWVSEFMQLIQCCVALSDQSLQKWSV